MTHLKVSVDPRIELLLVVQLLSEYDVLTKFDIGFISTVNDWFSSDSQHGAVKMFRDITSEEIYSDAYPTAMLYLSDPPELRQMPSFDNQTDTHIAHAFGGINKVSKFAALLRDFVAQSNYMEFFTTNRGYYDSLTSKLSEEMSRIDCIDVLERYFGMSQNSYNLILSPLLHAGGFGPRVSTRDGALDVYSIIGPLSAVAGMPMFGTGLPLLANIWHEFGHSFVNPLTESHYDRVSRCTHLYEPIQPAMKKMGYSSWGNCVNEHVIRAVVVRLVHQELDPEAADELLETERDRSFAYIDPLCDQLSRYETCRDQYQNLGDFYPELLAAFDATD